MKHDANYTVTVQGTNFLLTKSQIEFDAPNYFTTCFLGDFEEAKTLHLNISRDPTLFQIISDYLCGYTVLPLSDQVIPPRMSPALALVNLRVDAAFYQLDGLVEQCDNLIMREQIKKQPTRNYLVLGCEFVSSEKPFDINIYKATEPQNRWRTIVTEERLTQEPFSSMETPRSHQGFEGLRIVAAVERLAKEVERVERPLVGWHLHQSTSSVPGYGSRAAKFRLIIVLAM
ncbi:hypothetical protein RSOLAG22IIIB_13207 [Rhizoctonia solani]|uniref:BTB domain-containing protein n=1 Tax=Rhizoctonia solani TaxID=456999 RepID=A0A0K6GJ36_9AGAM|nr:unnamed protein product [Rhizoctonia solani]CUA78530.1 hypothetical protein RSOLAG22IIIB_13207 [Rhizoctonia solani]